MSTPFKTLWSRAKSVSGKLSRNVTSRVRRTMARALGLEAGFVDLPPTFNKALERLRQHNIQVTSVIDVGAGTGADVHAIKSVWPPARILLIEMDPQFEARYRAIRDEIPELEWALCAAGPYDGEGRMRKTNALGGAIVISSEHGHAQTRPISFRCIDSLVEEHKLKGPFFLRFDTHGFELDILSGARETLKQTELIMMEVYNFKLAYAEFRNLTFDEMSLHMKELGFRCIDLCSVLYRPGDGALWQMHMFFLRSGHPLFLRTGFSSAAAQRIPAP